MTLTRFLDDGNTTLLSANIEKLPDGGHRFHLDNLAHVGHAEEKVDTLKMLKF
jgi:hypothetical protein